MVTIVLAASEESKAELKEMGFKEQTVLVHYSLAVDSDQAKEKAKSESRMFAMRDVPFMFTTTSWWGAGPG
jgi:hypothetical protein